jgi:hypothetical protein
MPSPEIVEGMRQPRAVRLEDIRKSTDAAFAPVQAAHAPEGVTVYVSNSRSYLVEVQNVPSYVHEGRRYPAKRIAAQFENGIYRNDSKDPKVRALIDDALQSNKYFGRFGDGAAHFWLASDQKQVVESARVKSALETLKSLPKDVVTQYVAELAQGTAEDHVFTPAPSAQPSGKPAGVRPIATPAQ